MPPIIRGAQWLPRFKKAYRKLDRPIKDATDSTIRRLYEDMQHPSLHVEKIRGANLDVFSARVTRHWRISFEIDGDILILRNIASHDGLYSDP